MSRSDGDWYSWLGLFGVTERKVEASPDHGLRNARVRITLLACNEAVAIRIQNQIATILPSWPGSRYLQKCRWPIGTKRLRGGRVTNAGFGSECRHSRHWGTGAGRTRGELAMAPGSLQAVGVLHRDASRLMAGFNPEVRRVGIKRMGSDPRILQKTKIPVARVPIRRHSHFVVWRNDKITTGEP